MVGPGPFAGVLAIGVHQIGMLGKLFTEEMEKMNEDAIEAMHSVGANPVQTFFYARLPQVMPAYTSLVLNHFEIGVNTRRNTWSCWCRWNWCTINLCNPSRETGIK